MPQKDREPYDTGACLERYRKNGQKDGKKPAPVSRQSFSPPSSPKFPPRAWRYSPFFQRKRYTAIKSFLNASKLLYEPVHSLLNFPHGWRKIKWRCTQNCLARYSDILLSGWRLLPKHLLTAHLKTNGRGRILRENAGRALKLAYRQYRYILFLKQSWRKRLQLKVQPFPKPKA